MNRKEKFRDSEDMAEAAEDELCKECQGTGLVPVTITGITVNFECPKCDGSGVIIKSIL